MKKFSLQFIMALTAVFIAASCTNTKNKESADRHYQANGDAVYPAIEEMVPYAVKVDEKDDDKANLKVQILVGKMMDVDCNHHWLEGEFEDKTLEGYGYEYYIFETDGNVASTMMACPDEEKTSKFIHGEDQFISYNSKLVTPVYASEGYEVRYAIWNVDNEFNATQKPDESINAEAAKQLKSFPEAMEDYDRYVIYLPEEADEESLRLEVIPGVTKRVDCNTHWLIGDFETKAVEGMGYEYMVFESNGDIASTRMACPDDELIEKFVAANGDFGRYNSQLPVVVFVPKGIELKYKIWKANDMKVADKL
ncbi:MAG: ecotin family protein [Dysgonamonadaceae bacterium]|nr:ecotin family protein [Dysgonamonadaceae bacterium]MDD3357016.1 ecotin family protein [Dysgonamonadaceae bacterium]MDD3728609.1 ecotin family protein [Dysgonamonadaceae bacterium]MDD4247280.1 ecotin family protein [Dysgonamonadaceae bacterium]MDD4606356.1 ecotin family protein [Dysgonamonadaceae bacterium]